MAILKIIKKNSLLYSVLRWCHWQIRHTPLYFFKVLLIDPHHLQEDQRFYKRIKALQINKKISFFLDRQLEINNFFNLRPKQILSHYLEHGFPNSRKFSAHLSSYFPKNKISEKRLFTAYKKSAFDYSLRLMLAYERFSYFQPYFKYLQKKINAGKGAWKVLDYGCGVSDVGLLLSALGCQVTLVDIDDLKLAFACFRFKKRKFKVKCFPLKNISQLPRFRQKYDLIIASEIFEHVPDPLLLLKHFYHYLTPQGYLFDSMGGRFERSNKKGDHLQQASAIGNSESFKKYYKNHFQQLTLFKKNNFLFHKL